ncbi:MAG: hypothetical protein IKN61_01830 [Bacteroidaceae bacterium]|nr:hypothetical protein [Bacteroidaceae bacterium]
MIKDRKYRQKLIARYLEADTTVQEEIMLAEYYRTHKAEADEADVATLILMDYPVADILSDPERKRDIRFISMAITGIAACIALMVMFIIPRSGDEFTVTEIAENMNILMELNNQDVESIVAEPQGSKVVLTAKLKDGSYTTFIMVRDRRDGSTRIVAQNE